MKKVISMFLVCCLLAVMTMSAAAAPAPTPSIEDILNDYHAKASAAQSSGETRAAATYSRRGGGGSKTLEQETVDTLNEAGYEAYNVTGENYDTLEASLKTDFSAMGLDPDGSYIVVISGEEGSRTSGVSTYGRLPEQTIIDDGGDAPNSFKYTYNGHEYTMRYFTVTAASSDGLRVRSSYSIQAQYWLNNVTRNLFNTALVALADSSNEYIPIGTLASIFFDNPGNSVYTELMPGTLTIHAETDWTCEYIQIWDAADQKWEPAHWSEYTTSLAFCAGTVYDPVLNEPRQFVGQAHSSKAYSYWYHNAEQRKIFAVNAYNHYTITCDRVYSVDFFLGDEDGEIVFHSPNDPLFTHRYNGPIVLPDSD